jgi:hypothetical protein
VIALLAFASAIGVGAAAIALAFPLEDENADRSHPPAFGRVNSGSWGGLATEKPDLTRKAVQIGVRRGGKERAGACGRAAS